MTESCTGKFDPIDAAAMTRDDVRISPAEIDFFATHGYLGPFPLFDPDRGEALAGSLADGVARHPVLNGAASRHSWLARATGALARFARGKRSVRPPTSSPATPPGQGKFWYKSVHLFVEEARKLGRSPQVIERLRALVGQDILLWGAEVVKKHGVSHRWHRDIEHIAWEGVTVWIGIHNVGADNTMKVIPGSHLYDFTPQDLARKGLGALDDDDSLLAALRRSHPDAEIAKIAMTSGEFFIFAGPLWHASHDVSPKLRTALLCQYCPPSQRVRIPLSFEPSAMEFEPDQPCVLLVSGSDTHGVNHVRQSSDELD